MSKRLFLLRILEDIPKVYFSKDYLSNRTCLRSLTSPSNIFWGCRQLDEPSKEFAHAEIAEYGPGVVAVVSGEVRDGAMVPRTAAAAAVVTTAQRPGDLFPSFSLFLSFGWIAILRLFFNAAPWKGANVYARRVTAESRTRLESRIFFSTIRDKGIRKTTRFSFSFFLFREFSGIYVFTPMRTVEVKLIPVSINFLTLISVWIIILFLFLVLRSGSTNIVYFYQCRLNFSLDLIYFLSLPNL